MSDDAPVTTIEQLAARGYDTLNRRDLEGFLELIDPEVECTSLVAESEGRTYRGHDGVREWWSTVVESLGGLRYGVETVQGFGDRGYVKFEVIGTVGGVEIPQTMHQAFRVRSGKLCWWVTCRTEAQALEALGRSG